MSEAQIGIELFGGPADGKLLTVDAETRIWVTHELGPTPDPIIGVDDNGQAVAIPVLTHVYARTTKISPATGGRIFHYTGHRPAKGTTP